MSYGSRPTYSNQSRGGDYEDDYSDSHGSKQIKNGWETGSYGERRNDTRQSVTEWGTGSYGEQRNDSQYDGSGWGATETYGEQRSDAQQNGSGWGTDSYGEKWNDTKRDVAYMSRDLSNVQLREEDYSNISSFERFFYKPLPIVERRSQAEIEQIRDRMGITVQPRDVCPPVTTFEEAFEDSQQYILESIQKLNFTTPTPIQCQSWPIVLSGHDMIGIAETGSGKTLAYLLPGIVHMLHQPDVGDDEGPLGLILAPTRELSVQIFEECEKFAKSCLVKSCVIYGGAKKSPQIRELRQGVHLVVATPGRLIDMLEARHTNMRRVTYLVLDEADRMLDMGFEPQIRKIVNQIRPDRQTVLWSATWPPDVQDIAAEFLRDPIKVTIGSDSLKANHNITQKFEMLCYGENKLNRLVDLLTAENGKGRILIFCGTKRNVDDVTRHLREMGFGALAIHGDKEQNEREWVLEEFKRGSSPIMLATDVAQRGLDIKDVYCVVNYDLPNTGEDYVHRIGRTGRAGSRGLAISFLSEYDSKFAKVVVRVLREAGQEIPYALERLARNEPRDADRPYRSFPRSEGNSWSRRSERR